MTVPLGRMIDLSMPIEEHWRWKPSFEDKFTPRPQFTFHTTMITMGSHGFTHVDAPYHTDQSAGATRLDDIDLSHFWGPASLVDVSDLGDEAPISREVLTDRVAHVERGDILLIRSNQEDRHPTTTKDYWTKSAIRI